MKRVNLLKHFKPLFERQHRYYIFKGGRASGKSWGIADSLLILGRMTKERILCTREIQKSIETSAYQLLVDRINYHGYNDYQVTKTSIVNQVTGTEFIFAGLSDITGTADSLKSIENISICWCFPAGTKIDGKNIEEIRVGDWVNSFNHTTKEIEKKQVVRVMKRKAPNKLIRLNFGAKKSIICTSEHPIFVDGFGYKKASEIKVGECVYEKVRFAKRSSLFGRLWENVADYCSTAKNKVCEAWRLLLPRLCEKNECGKNEKAQSNEKRAIKKENDKGVAFDGTQTDGSWWQWKRLYRGTKGSCKKAWSWMVGRVASSNGSMQGRKRIANEFQDRHCKHLLWDCDRIGWSWSLWGHCQSRGREKREVLKKQRVDSVEVLEQSSIARLGLSDGGNYVYNLEVQGNNNYFANGLLVHNCEEAQTVSDKSFEKLTPSIRGRNGNGEPSIIILSYNPETINDPVHLRFIENEQPRSYICHINYLDNPYCPKEIIEEAETLKKNKPDDYKRIWLGVPDDISARAVVKYFSQENITDVAYCPEEDLILTMDFNVDPMMWCVCHKDDECLYCMDEIVIENCTTEDAVAEFINRYPNHKGNIILCGDASGQYRKTQSNLSDYMIIKNALLRHGYRADKVIQNTRGFNPPIHNRVKAFNQLVFGNDGERRFYVDPKCKWVIYNMKNLMYKEGTSIIDLPTPSKIESNKDLKFLGHIFDAISYPAEYYWPITLENNEQPVIIDPAERWTMKNIIEKQRENERKNKW